MQKNVMVLLVLIVLYISNLCILTGTLINFGLLHISTEMGHKLAFLEKLASEIFYFFAKMLNFPEPGLAGDLELATLTIISLLLGLSIIFFVWKLSREKDCE